jgi:hypothetical protein
MAGFWEVRGFFGNEYAMEGAIDELKKLKGIEYEVIDRRNLSVRLRTKDEELRNLVKNAIVISHGFVEADSPLGMYEETMKKERAKKLREFEKKKRKGH